MNKINKIYMFLLFAAPLVAQANIIELSCNNPSSGMSNYVVVDTTIKTVLDNKFEGSNVSIDKNSISYDLLFKKGESEFTVKINRTTGKMIVINLLTKAIDSTYECESVKPKF